MPHARPGTSDGFMLDLVVCGGKKSMSHLSLPFEAVFYTAPGDPTPTPYVGVVDLAGTGGKNAGRVHVPRRGIVQAVVHNPQRTGIKLFAVSYNLDDMPANTHTFLRQRSVLRVATHKHNAGALRYLIHLRFVCSDHGRVYLYRQIQVIFAARAPDRGEHLDVTTDMPDSPRYIPQSTAATPVRADPPVRRAPSVEWPRRLSVSPSKSKLSISRSSSVNES